MRIGGTVVPRGGKLPARGGGFPSGGHSCPPEGTVAPYPVKDQYSLAGSITRITWIGVGKAGSMPALLPVSQYHVPISHAIYRVMDGGNPS